MPDARTKQQTVIRLSLVSITNYNRPAIQLSFIFVFKILIAMFITLDQIFKKKRERKKL